MKRPSYRIYKTTSRAEKYRAQLAKQHPDLDFIVVLRDFHSYVVAARAKVTGHLIGWCA